MKLSRFLHRRMILLCLDAIFLSLSYVGAYVLRVGGEAASDDRDLILMTVPVLALATVAVLVWLGVYRSFTKFAGMDIALKVFKGVTVGNLLFVAYLVLVYRLEGIPRGVLVINWMGNILLVGGSRLAWRALVQARQVSPGGKGVLIYGSVEESEGLLREFAAGRMDGYWPVGLVEPDPNRQGRRIHNITVFGGAGTIEDAARDPRVEEIHFAGKLPDRRLVQQFLDATEERPVRFRTIPSVTEAAAGEPLLTQARDLRIEDLLKREPKNLDLKGIRDFIHGRSVLVTGAGGSIGSELVYQIAQNEPSSLVLVEFSEEKLHRMRMDVAAKFPGLPVADFLTDVADRAAMETIFNEHRPDLVFHAAAYKHVHLVEMNPGQGIANNVEGLQVPAELAARFGASAFVFISTDKAAQPVNIMGATKRLGECFLKTMNAESECKFVCVRFGNVLGSSGSVVPTFREQILSGGPVTVTDPEMTRYFMLPSEAVQLILQAASLGEGGKVYVLDMGSPVSIEQLAKDMIRLLGRVPDRDVSITYTGLRPGEKLHEDLCFPEHREETEFSGTWEDNYVHPDALPATSENLEALVSHARAGEIREAVCLLERLVPDLEPMYEETREYLKTGDRRPQTLETQEG